MRNFEVSVDTLFGRETMIGYIDLHSVCSNLSTFITDMLLGFV